MAGVAVMVRDKYAVRLAPEQREELQNLIRVGKSSARVTARARILLKSDDGWVTPRLAEPLDVALGTASAPVPGDGRSPHDSSHALVVGGVLMTGRPGGLRTGRPCASGWWPPRAGDPGPVPSGKPPPTPAMPAGLGRRGPRPIARRRAKRRRTFSGR